MKWLFLLIAAGSAAASLLTFVHAPDWRWTWKLAIVAGEFGYWLVLLPLGLAVLAGMSTEGAWRISILLLCGIAMIGFFRPAFSAWRIASRLPGEMQAAFGGNNSPSRPVFDFSRLYRGSSTSQVKVTTETFAGADGGELKLDFYAPPLAKDTSRRPPCMIVIHGGGWDSGDRTQLAEWNRHWATCGYAVAAVSYRLAPRWIWPAQRDDVLAAIAWLKVHADTLGFDPARFVLLGRSAGGQIATAVAYGANDPAIRGVVALYAPHDMPFAWSVSRVDDTLNSIQLLRHLFGGAPEEGNQARYESASGQLLVHAGSPPTLLIHGTHDTLAWYRHSERLTARLGELKVPHYYLRLPWATHGFDFNRDGPGGQLADYAIDRFLNSVVR